MLHSEPARTHDTPCCSRCLVRNGELTHRPAREQIYVNGVRSITLVPSNVGIAGVTELFSIYPNCLSITWLSGNRASRATTRSTAVDSQHRFMTANHYTDQLEFLTNQRQVSPLSTSEPTAGNLNNVRSRDTSDLIISNCCDLYGIYKTGRYDVHTLAIDFGRAEGIFGLNHRRLEIRPFRDREQWYNAAFTHHLKSRHTKGLVPYIEIHLHEPADSQSYASRALEAFKAIVDYNPSLTTLHFASQVRTRRIHADLGTEQLLTQCEWHRLPHLESLSIMLELDCRQTKETATQTSSIRPECKLWRDVQTYTRSRDNHVEPGTLLPKRCPKLQRFVVELHSMSQDPWLPNMTFVAQCLVAIGGPYCCYDVDSAEGHPLDRLPIVVYVVRLLERAIEVEVERERAGEVQGWRRKVKNVSDSTPVSRSA